MADTNAALDELREAFDQSFAREHVERRTSAFRFLRIRAGGTALALDVRELSGLHSGRTIARIPGATLPLLGLAAVRAELFPVYDLAHMLGFGGAPARHRYLAIARSHDAAAFAFDELVGSLDAGDGDVHLRPARAQTDAITGFLEPGGEPLAVVSVAALVASIEARLPPQETK